MALIHRATLAPTKLELLEGWLPRRLWAGPGEVEVLGAYRFDDPAGEVGIETFLLQAGGRVLQVPLTYRSAPLAGTDADSESCLGTTEHSVRGTRWVYDGCTDPVWLAAVAAAALTGGTHADAFMARDGELVALPTSATASGTGTPGVPVPPVGPGTPVTARDDGSTTIVIAEGLEVVLVRAIGTEVAGEASLLGSWKGADHAGPVVLATVRRTA